METTPMARPKSGLAGALYRRVWFAAAPDADTRFRPLSFALLALWAALLTLPARSHPLLEPDEGRYAQIAREMAESGSYLVPTLQGEPYLDKPPLFYWLVTLSYRMLGVGESSARLVPALAVLATILAVYAIGRRGVGERGALLAALLLSVAPGFATVGRVLLLDGVLTLFVTLSLLCGYEAVRTGTFQWRWWLAAAVASGLGFLTKGPISEVLLFPPLLLAGRLARPIAPVRLPAALAFGAVVVAVNLPWYVGMVRTQPEFLKHFFWEHNVMRFARPFDHLQPVWYYAPLVLGGFLPGVVAAAWLARKQSRAAPALSQSGGFWLVAGGWCLFFFSCSGSKLPTYILPAYPALCLALGEGLARAGGLRLRGVQLGGILAGALMLALHWVGLPWYAHQRSPLREPHRVLPYVSDRSVPVVAYPRHVDSVAFAVGRSDIACVRSKDLNELLLSCHFRPRTVILLTHQHSLASLRGILPPSLRLAEVQEFRTHSKLGKLAGETPWGLCALVVVEPSGVPPRALTPLELRQVGAVEGE